MPKRGAGTAAGNEFEKEMYKFLDAWGVLRRHQGGEAVGPENLREV